MAYFANGSEGSCFDQQCSICKYGEKSCPIAAVQGIYNYNAVAAFTRNLVQDDGTCTMFKTFKKDFEIADKPTI